MRRIGTAAIALVVCIAAVGLVNAQATQGKPLQEIWDALAQLASRITALESLPPPQTGSSAPRVINSAGDVIGFYDGDRLLHFDGARWLTIGPISSQGFSSDGFAVFFFDQINCTGSGYLNATPERPLARYVIMMSGTGYYAGDPYNNVMLRSSRNGVSGACSNAPQPFTRWVGPVVTFSTAALGYPPFRIE